MTGIIDQIAVELETRAKAAEALATTWHEQAEARAGEIIRLMAWGEELQACIDRLRLENEDLRKRLRARPRKGAK